MENYVSSLINPFDTKVLQPKIFDGSVSKSAGLRFRSTGQIILNGTGAVNYFVLMPGFSNTSSWTTDNTNWSTPPAHPSHYGTATDRANIGRLRLVGAATRLTLMNTSDDNEGYWEAIRVPWTSIATVDATAPIGEDGLIYPAGNLSTLYPTFSNHSTYQMGRLRDIHRYMFKLNSVAPDHPFVKPMQPGSNTGVGSTTLNAPWALPDLLDQNFDCIIIKIFGRIDAVNPSTIMFDTATLQEVEYRDGTALGRLMTTNTMLPNMGVLLDRTRFAKPAIQVA